MTTMNEEERDQLHAEIARLRAELEADRGMYAGQLANAAHERDDALVEVTRLTAELAARPPIALDVLGERRRIEALAQQHFDGAATDSDTWYRIREFMLAMGSTGAYDEITAAHDVLNKYLAATQVFEHATQTERPMTLAERIDYLATHPCPPAQKEQAAIIEVKKHGEQSCETWLHVGVQSFQVAHLYDDDEAHGHCVFIAQRLYHALSTLGITAVCEGFELQTDRTAQGEQS